MRELDLSCNNLSFKGASFIGKLLESSISLIMLNLSETNIGASGCDLIVDGLIKNPNATLSRLDLRMNEAGDRQVCVQQNNIQKHLLLF